MKKLNWDFTDHNQAQAEYNIKEQKIDYALLGKNKEPIIIIEMKTISTTLEDSLKKEGADGKKYINQLRYSGAQSLIISNGLTSRIYVNDK